jgi:hypothetical protein
MQKTIALLVQKESLAEGTLARQLMAEFATAAKSVVGVRGLIVHEIVREMTRADIPVLLIGDRIDAIVEYWGDSAARTMVLQLLPDSVARLKAFDAQEDVIIPLKKPRAAIKTIAFLCRKQGEELGVFRHHWHDGHGGMARVVPYLQGFMLNDITGVAARSDIPAIAFGNPDGFAEGWLESPEAQQKMVATPEAKAWFADGAQTFGQIKSFLTRERVVIEPDN